MTRLTLPILAHRAPPDHPAIAAAAEALAAGAQGPRDIRFVKTLRVSVTDHCNFRCIYCMPEDGVDWLPRADLLTYEEIVEVCRAAIGHGIRDFKLTGGEPLLRKDLAVLARLIRALPGAGEISLTTNGLLLERHIDELADAGVARITVSLDTLDAPRFRAITRTGDLATVRRGIAAADQRLGPTKLNVVVMRSYNLDELASFAALTIDSPRTVRLIEFMPLADSRLLHDPDEFVPYDEMRSVIEARLGPLEPAPRDVGNGPAHVWRVRGGAGRIGFIHAMTAPFCATCNRLRLTPDGQLRSCLFDGGEIDLRPLLRPVTFNAQLRQAFLDCVVLKPDAHQHYGNRQMSRIGG
ncbi:MAG: GTP 3',8-cyclase MoaA [Phycisphaerae bacterium]